MVPIPSIPARTSAGDSLAETITTCLPASSRRPERFPEKSLQSEKITAVETSVFASPSASFGCSSETSSFSPRSAIKAVWPASTASGVLTNEATFPKSQSPRSCSHCSRLSRAESGRRSMSVYCHHPFSNPKIRSRPLRERVTSRNINRPPGDRQVLSCASVVFNSEVAWITLVARMRSYPAGSMPCSTGSCSMSKMSNSMEPLSAKAFRASEINAGPLSVKV